VSAGKPDENAAQGYLTTEVQGINVWHTPNIVPENENEPIVISATKSLIFYNLEISGAKQYITKRVK
jgi:hypothetical protein